MSQILNTRDYEEVVVEYLNSREDESRKHTRIDSIELINNDYYRVESNYTDHFIRGDFDDTGIYFIDKCDLDAFY